MISVLVNPVEIVSRTKYITKADFFRILMKKNTIDNVTKNTLTLTGIRRYIFNFTVLYLLFRGRCFLDYTVYVNPNKIKKQS